MKRDAIHAQMQKLYGASAVFRDRHTMPLNLGDELIIDNFAGGGGTSTGLESAFGRPVDYAINHCPEALALHTLNHPYTEHLCESVWDVDPLELTKGRPVGSYGSRQTASIFQKPKAERL